MKPKPIPFTPEWHSELLRRDLNKLLRATEHQQNALRRAEHEASVSNLSMAVSDAAQALHSTALIQKSLQEMLARLGANPEKIIDEAASLVETR